MAAGRPSRGPWFALGFLTGFAVAAGLAAALWIASIVRPQFAESSPEARTSSLITDLQTVRSQLLLYKTQHAESFPGRDFARQMTMFTDAAGNVSPRRTDTHAYGPYLPSVPANPITGSRDVKVVSDPRVSFTVPEEDGGWWYNAATGEFRADLADAHKAPDGTRLNRL